MKQLSRQQEKAIHTKRAMYIQSVLFDKRKFTLNTATKWIGKKRMRNLKVDITSNYLRFRQQDPKRFHFMRIKKLGNSGIKFVVGR